jgi:hypothetical protein
MNVQTNPWQQAVDSVFFLRNFLLRLQRFYNADTALPALQIELQKQQAVDPVFGFRSSAL